MKKTLSTAALSLAAALATLGGCQNSKHPMTGSQSGMTPVCKECYDAVTAAHRTHPNPGANTNEVISTSQCPCCKTEMSVYCENGTMKVKCGGCAHNGVAFDKCMPPSAGAGRSWTCAPATRLPGTWRQAP